MERTYVPQAGGMPPGRPKNWLIESILVTIFCCLPFGIAGIVFASQVNSKYDLGDYMGADRASREARKWTLVAFFIGGGWLIVLILFALVSSLSLGGLHFWHTSVLRP